LSKLRGSAKQIIKIEKMGIFSILVFFSLSTVLFSGFLEPVEIQFPTCPYFIKDIKISGNLAFMVTYNHGLRVIDVSNLKEPMEIGHYNNRFSSSRFSGFENVSVSGNYAYLAQNTEGLKVLDISEPSKPRLINTYQSPRWITSVSAVGSLACITVHWEGMRVLDVSNPDSIREIGKLRLNDLGDDVQIHGQYAYVHEAYEHFVIDISQPNSPKQVGHFWDECFMEDIVIKGDYVFAADGGDGLTIFDITNLDSIINVANYDFDPEKDPKGRAVAVRLFGNCAYLLSENGDIYKADISAYRKTR